MDFCIVIRTMALNGRTLSVRAGCGVVADSDPADEYQETLNKARAIFRAVELAGSLE
jgi:anthranilate synthase component 1